MSPTLDLNPKLDYPTAFESLHDFYRAVVDSISTENQALTNYLLERFRVSDHGVFFHSGDSTPKD